MDEYAVNPETGGASTPHFSRDGQPLPADRPVRNTVEVTYGIEIATADGESWIETMWRDYQTPEEAWEFADATFTGRRNWRLVKRTVITVVEVVDWPVTGNGV